MCMCLVVGDVFFWGVVGDKVGLVGYLNKRIERKFQNKEDFKGHTQNITPIHPATIIILLLMISFNS